MECRGRQWVEEIIWDRKVSMELLKSLLSVFISASLFTKTQLLRRMSRALALQTANMALNLGTRMVPGAPLGVQSKD